MHQPCFETRAKPAQNPWLLMHVQMYTVSALSEAKLKHEVKGVNHLEFATGS